MFFAKNYIIISVIYFVIAYVQLTSVPSCTNNIITTIVLGFFYIIPVKILNQLHNSNRSGVYLHFYLHVVIV